MIKEKKYDCLRGKKGLRENLTLNVQPTPLILAYQCQRQADLCEFQYSQGYIDCPK